MALAGIGFLGGCSATQFSEPEPEPELVAATTTRTGAAASYNYVHQPTYGTPDRVVRLTESVEWYYYPNAIDGIPENFSVYLQATEGYLLRALTDDGTGEVIIVDNGTQLARIGDTLVPTYGSAIYTGSYGGIVVDGARDMSPETVSGSVQIDVDFGGGDVSGTIFDRVYDGGTIADDVTLTHTSMTDGAFLGITSGGDLNSDGLVAGYGTYTGLIVGPDGEGIVGSVTISHSGDDTFTEIGGFVLSQ
jgi:hypothetical protein